jgi:3-oxoacyl-[acyl-carrier protein] reductase
VDLGLAGARALVGGGSRGLGAAVADALAEDGAAVAVAARESGALRARTGGPAIAADLSTEHGPADAVAGAVAELGGLDLLVVNCGGPPAGTFAEIDDGAWGEAIDRTLLSAVRLIRAAVPHLRGSERAAIAVVLSSSVRMPIGGLVTSNVLRPGLVGLIKTLAAELAPEIRINGAAPGRIRTTRTDELDRAEAARKGQTPEAVRDAHTAAIPLGREGRVAEFGRAVAFLLSPAAAYISGQVLSIDGAMTRTYP